MFSRVAYGVGYISDFPKNIMWRNSVKDCLKYIAKHTNTNQQSFIVFKRTSNNTPEVFLTHENFAQLMTELNSIDNMYFRSKGEQFVAEKQNNLINQYLEVRNTKNITNFVGKPFNSF